MATSPASSLKLWRERIVSVIVAQLLQGVTPQKIALSIALGLSLGVFPILGTTTMLCALAALRLKLNQPIIQLVNWLVYPLELALVLVFIRIGEWIMHVPLTSFSLSELVQKCHQAPLKFLQEFGVMGLHGVIAWLFIAPILTAVTYSVLLPVIKMLASMTARSVNARNVD